MRIHHRLLMLAACFASCADSALVQGSVEVRFVDPDNFVDAGEYGARRAINLKALQAHLQRLGQERLAANRVLKVEVLDVDLAGSVEPSPTVGSIRVVTSGADRPGISLRYTLLENGVVLKSGEDSLSDLAFLERQHRFREAPESLRHEKRLLTDWFAATL